MFKFIRNLKKSVNELREKEEFDEVMSQVWMTSSIIIMFIFFYPILLLLMKYGKDE